MKKVFQNWNQEWKTPQYDQGSIGLKKIHVVVSSV